jgi:hypothetical protein
LGRLSWRLGPFEICAEITSQQIIPAAPALAFTLAPHLQRINHRDCFSPFGGI